MGDSKFNTEKYIIEEFKFDYGRVLDNVQVQYVTRGTPKYDDEGNIINAFIFCHRFNGDCTSFDELNHLIGIDSALSDYDLFYISITSLGFPESCSPSTTNLKYDFPPSFKVMGNRLAVTILTQNGLTSGWQEGLSV